MVNFELVEKVVQVGSLLEKEAGVNLLVSAALHAPEGAAANCSLPTRVTELHRALTESINVDRPVAQAKEMAVVSAMVDSARDPVFLPALFSSDSRFAKLFHDNVAVPEWNAPHLWAEGVAVPPTFSMSNWTDLTGEGVIGAKKIAETRLPLIQAGANAAADAARLPRPTLELIDEDAFGWQLPGTSTVGLNINHVVENNVEDVVATTGHEMTHLDQDSLLIRDLADQAGVKKFPSKKQRAWIQDSYRGIRNLKLEDSYLEGVLAVRDGEFLLPEEQKRAEYFRQFFPKSRVFKSLHFDAIEETYRLTEFRDAVGAESTRGLNKALNPFHPVRLISDPIRQGIFQHSPELQNLIGSLNMGAKTFWHIPQPAAASLRSRLSAVADGALRDARARADKFFDAYESRFDECEANDVGRNLRTHWMHLQNSTSPT